LRQATMNSEAFTSTTGNSVDMPRNIHCQFSPSSQIINEFRDCFFSLINHFMVLASEMLEKFLVCSKCVAPIGFIHQPKCSKESSARPNIWKKIKYDDKFITFAMKFSFHEMLGQSGQKRILANIASACCKQNLVQFQLKPTLTLYPKTWPSTWIREKEKKKQIMRKAIMETQSAPVQDELDDNLILKPLFGDDEN
jgi:hypothetical protein